MQRGSKPEVRTYAFLVKGARVDVNRIVNAQGKVENPYPNAAEIRKSLEVIIAILQRHKREQSMEQARLSRLRKEERNIPKRKAIHAQIRHIRDHEIASITGKIARLQDQKRFLEPMVNASLFFSDGRVNRLEDPAESTSTAA
jgi:hypothetical protein